MCETSAEQIGHAPAREEVVRVVVFLQGRQSEEVGVRSVEGSDIVRFVDGSFVLKISHTCGVSS